MEKYIKDNSIGKGTRINITRSGDVIPYIVNVIESSPEPSMPDFEWKWNETNVEILLVKETKEVFVKKINSFFKTLEIKEIAMKTIEKLYDNGFDTIQKLLIMKPNEIIDIDGFGEKKSNIICDNIKSGIEKATLYQVVSASGLLGNGIGLKKLKILFSEIPDLLNNENENLREQILNIGGFQTKTVDKILSNISKVKEFLKDIEFVEKENQIKISSNSRFQNKKIVFYRV